MVFEAMRPDETPGERVWVERRPKDRALGRNTDGSGDVEDSVKETEKERPEGEEKQEHVVSWKVRGKRRCKSSLLI